MSTFPIRPRRAAGLVTLAVAATTALAALPGGASARTLSVSGPVTAYAVAGGNPLEGVTARVHQTVTDSGQTIVSLHLKGFGADAEGTTFGAHAHVNPCGAAGADAGPHYTHPDTALDLEDQEIWLDYTVDDGGNARAKAKRDWTIVPTAAAPNGARSVIFHALPTNHDGTAGTRLGCISVPFSG